MIGVRHRKNAMVIRLINALFVQSVFISFLLYLFIITVVLPYHYMIPFVCG